MKVQSIDAVATVAHILTVANHAALAGIYELGKERFRSVEEFLTELAMKLSICGMWVLRI